jgi:hypothetical protein
MAAEARISHVWSMQKFLISIFFLLVGAWFFFDGAVKWPRSNVRWLAYEQHEKEGRMAEWPAYAAERGWVKKKPEKYYDASALAAQYIFGGLAVAVGGLLFTYWFTQRHRLLRTDGEAVTTPSGKRVPFTAVVGIGKKKWESKGLATVRYEENGCQRQFIVDDYKFETEPARQILAEIEEHLVARNGGQ